MNPGCCTLAGLEGAVGAVPDVDMGMLAVTAVIAGLLGVTLKVDCLRSS